MNQSGNPFGNPLFNLPDMGNFDKTLREAMSKLPMAPDLGRAGAQMQGMGQSMADAFRTLSQLQISPAELGRIQTEYLRQAAELPVFKKPCKKLVNLLKLGEMVWVRTDVN